MLNVRKIWWQTYISNLLFMNNNLICLRFNLICLCFFSLCFSFIENDASINYRMIIPKSYSKMQSVPIVN